MSFLFGIAIGLGLGKVTAEQWAAVWTKAKAAAAWAKAKAFKPKAPK